jgi:hypothetical protein
LDSNHAADLSDFAAIALIMLATSGTGWLGDVDMAKLKIKDQDNDVSSEDTGVGSMGSGSARVQALLNASSSGSLKVAAKQRSRPAWHELEIESDEQLNDPNSSEDFSGGFSSGLCTPNSEQSGSQKNLKKLRNRPITKDEYLRRKLVENAARQDNGSGYISSDNGTCLSDASFSNSFHTISVRDDGTSDDCSEPPPCTRHHDGDLPYVDGEAVRPDLASLDLPSIGAALHATGNCKPCLFVHSKVGCNNSAECSFCHFVHGRSHKARPCKNKRERYKKLVERSLTGGGGSVTEEQAEEG